MTNNTTTELKQQIEECARDLWSLTNSSVCHVARKLDRIAEDLEAADPAAHGEPSKADQHAIMEGARIASAEEYFKARPQLDYIGNRRIFESGFQRGFEASKARCPYCDGTGDVHDQTGEWRGECNCKAGSAEQLTEREAFEKWARSLDLDLWRVPYDDDFIYSDCNTDYAWLAWQASAPSWSLDLSKCDMTPLAPAIAPAIVAQASAQSTDATFIDEGSMPQSNLSPWEKGVRIAALQDEIAALLADDESKP